jgi:3-phenylpropionate/trans-cinnamate dioxygenase ferredoxin component
VKSIALSIIRSCVDEQGNAPDNAGVMADPEFIDVAALTDVPPDTVKAVSVDGTAMLIIHTDDGIFAVENRCSHADQPLECGRVKYGWISCPAHGSKFDLETGEALTRPATDPIAIFAVRITGDRIEVAL